MQRTSRLMTRILLQKSEAAQFGGQMRASPFSRYATASRSRRVLGRRLMKWEATCGRSVLCHSKRALAFPAARTRRSSSDDDWDASRPQRHSTLRVQSPFGTLDGAFKLVGKPDKTAPPQRAVQEKIGICSQRHS